MTKYLEDAKHIFECEVSERLSEEVLVGFKDKLNENKPKKGKKGKKKKKKD